MAECDVRNSEDTQTSTIILENEEANSIEPVPSMRVKLKKPKSKKKVAWTADTVDNENMNKKKSKCCCIYEKPRALDESSSESDDECEHCKGHVEHKAKSRSISQNQNYYSDPTRS